MESLWKIYCDEKEHPGQWLQWYRHQCAAFGWPPQDGYHLLGDTESLGGWSRVRNVMKTVQPGDWAVISLPGNRVGRLGQIVRTAVEDSQWDPLVRRSSLYPHGENGRRILLRWDMTVGPDNKEMVVKLTNDFQFKSGYEQRGTIRQIKSLSREKLSQVMNDPSNWVPVQSTFDREKSLSDYIAAYPHRLEEGMVRHPSQSVREKCFPDRTRSDAVLQDRDERLVVVECKKNSPQDRDLAQLSGYMRWMSAQFPEFGVPRGILVHGGSRRVHANLMRDATAMGIELVYHRLSVDFLSSDSGA